QKKVPLRLQQKTQLVQNGLLGLRIEVDEHVAQEDDVHRRKRRPTADEVHAEELHHRTQLALHAPFQAATLEVLHDHRGRKAAIDPQLVVAAVAGSLDHRSRYIAGLYANRPAGTRRKELLHHNRQAVRFLSARAGPAPDIDRARRAIALQKFRKDVLTQRI